MLDFLGRYWHDIISGVVTVILMVGVIVLVILEKKVPEFLVGAMGTALGWTFHAGVNAVVVKRAAPRRKATGPA